MATILIADDRPANRKALRALLNSEGYSTIEASDGAQALALARAHRPDLIITDVLMPSIDGYELVRLLREEPAIARTPVIFYTAHYDEREVRGLAAAAGIVDVLLKPAPNNLLLRAVASALSQSAPPPEPPPPELFDREHLRLLTDKLAHKVDELQEANRRLTALVELGQQLALEYDPLRLLQTYCDAARDLMGAQYAAIGLFDGPEELSHLVASGLDPAMARAMAAAEPYRRLLEPLLGERRVLSQRGLSTMLQRAGLPAYIPPIDAFLGVAIASPTSVHGWLALGNKPGAADFSADDASLAVALAAQMAVAYENARLLAEVRLGRERLQALSRQLMAAQETERREIARELHDEIGQALTAAQLNLQAIERVPQAATLAPHLEDTMLIVESVLQQVRDLSLDLRPSLLDDLGLPAALRWYVRRQAARAGFAAHCEIDELAGRPPSGVEIACFRVAQEALTNVARHAHARGVKVELRQQGGQLLLSVRDDGAGFDVQAAQARAAHGGSLGLLGMQERAQLAGGTLEITSTPGQGATVQARFPLA